MSNININSKTTKAELADYIAELEAKLAALEEAKTNATEEAATTAEAVATPVTQNVTPTVAATVQAQPNFVFTMPSTDVTVVYLSDSLGYAKVSNAELHFNRYGEKFTLSRSTFDELVGKYHRWFDTGILAVSSDNLDIAASKGLKTDKEYNLTSELLESIGKMSSNQLEKLWNETASEAHKQSIVCYMKRKFIEGDPLYMNREKVDLMNRLTNGGFAREQDELSGRYKVNPTEM